MLYRYADDLGDPGRDDAYGYGLPVLTRYFHDRLCPGQRFRDMPAPDIWSHEGLDYCIAAGLISGTSEVTVSPDMLATRAQIVQLLWAAAGSPETAGTLPVYRRQHRRVVLSGGALGVSHGPRVRHVGDDL